MQFSQNGQVRMTTAKTYDFVTQLTDTPRPTDGAAQLQFNNTHQVQPASAWGGAAQRTGTSGGPSVDAMNSKY